MNLAYQIIPFKLQFAFEAGTSRGVLKEKPSWFIKLWNQSNSDIFGIGEVSVIEGLSIDFQYINTEIIDVITQEFIKNSCNIDKISMGFPSIKFGLEMAYLDLLKGGKRHFFNTSFSSHNVGIDINGLIWMGDKNIMLRRIQEKIEDGFRCLKLKIGAINFEDELELLKTIRTQFSANDLEIRVDANGAFDIKNALYKLFQLSEFQIHSIEQPIKQGQIFEMQELVKHTPISIALDEELIGIKTKEAKENLLETILPQYIILKPSLLGGFGETKEWIDLAEKKNIKWWITSALESNIGLNAIAQFTSTFNTNMPQGLGTGQIYSNNISSPLEVKNAKLYYNQLNNWDLNLFNE